MNNVLYPAVFVRDPENDSVFSVYFPDLPGALTYGDTLADAILMAQDCAGSWLFDELELGQTFPKASKVDSISFEKGQFVQYIAVDMDEFVRKHSQRVVRKNVSIPAWLNTFGERNHINFSEVLTRGLEDIFQQTKGNIAE